MGTANQTRIPPASPYPRCRPHAQPLAQRPPPPRPQSPTLSSNPEYVAYPGEQSARKCRASSNSRRYRHFNTTTDSPTPSRIPPSPPSPVTNAANAAKPSPHPMHGSIMNPEYYTLSQMQTTRTYSVGDPTLPPPHRPTSPSMETLHGWLFQPPRPAKRWLGSGRLPWRRPRRRPLPLRTVRPCLPRQRGSTLSRSRAGQQQHRGTQRYR